MMGVDEIRKKIIQKKRAKGNANVLFWTASAVGIGALINHALGPGFDGANEAEAIMYCMMLLLFAVGAMSIRESVETSIFMLEDRLERAEGTEGGDSIKSDSGGRGNEKGPMEGSTA